MPTRGQLAGKTAAEKASIKASAILSTLQKGVYTSPATGLTIEVADTIPIDRGVQVLVRAWNNGIPVGFGKNKTIETERINVINPPILIEDPLGDILQQWTDEIDGTIYTRRLREDPEAAIKHDIAHTISIIGQQNAAIIPGTVGNTVSTFYPDASPETSSVDGYTYKSGGGTYASVHDASNADDATDNGTSQTLRNNTSFEVLRMIFVFDTSSIPDTDTIDSAVASFYPSAAGSSANSESVSLVEATTASNTALAVGDYDGYGTTKLASDITMASWSTGAYKDFTLNGTGIALISKTGTTKLGLRTSGDVSNTAPTGANTAGVYFADQTGTTNDPKLVVTHSASASGPANLKTRNTTAKASIKTINSTAIANVKTINTIA